MAQSIIEVKHLSDVYKRQLLTPYEAIATAVGGSVGFGNIAGVATAVTTGGPGAVFWMWLTAFLGMLIKQVEVSLAVYYRRTDENGVPYGGPTYYMERGLGEERHWLSLIHISARGTRACCTAPAAPRTEAARGTRRARAGG